MLTVPLACAGVIACNWVGLTTMTEAAETPPKATEADCVNPVPEMVTKVPPATDPLPGPMPLIASWELEWPQPLPENPAAKLTVMVNARTGKAEKIRRRWRLLKFDPKIRILAFPFLCKLAICASGPPSIDSMPFYRPLPQRVIGSPKAAEDLPSVLPEWYSRLPQHLHGFQIPSAQEFFCCYPV